MNCVKTKFTMIKLKKTKTNIQATSFVKHKHKKVKNLM